MVKKYDSFRYHLFEDFDSALECAKKLHAKYNSRIDIYECDFNTRDRQFRAQNTFWISYGGKVRYDKYGEISLHIEFYINAGEWMNPRQDWIDLIHEIWERQDVYKEKQNGQEGTN